VLSAARREPPVISTGANIVATANPGCLLQIMNGAKQAGMNLRVVHPITLLAEAYRDESRTQRLPDEPRVGYAHASEMAR